MAKSERAKELAAKQKAEAKALREKKRNSDNPRDWSTFRQIRESFKITREVDPQLIYWLVGAFLLATLVGLGVGLAMESVDLGSGDGHTARRHRRALYTLTWRTKKASYTRYKGVPGAGEVPLSMLNKKKWTVQPAIAVTRQQDCIHRVVGAPGVVLVADGGPGRLKPLLNTEVKRHQQVLYGIEVSTIMMGDGPGQVPMDKYRSRSAPGQARQGGDRRGAEPAQGSWGLVMEVAHSDPEGPIAETNMKGSRKANARPLTGWPIFSGLKPFIWNIRLALSSTR